MLYKAVCKGHLEVVKLLLSKGLKSQLVVEKGYTKIVKLLLNNGTDVNIKDKRGRTT